MTSVYINLQVDGDNNTLLLYSYLARNVGSYSVYKQCREDFFCNRLEGVFPKYLV